MRELDYETVVAINAEVGGPGSGVRVEGGLRGAVQRPFDTFLGDELYEGPWLKAAALMHGIASPQYFSDGNKRTGFAAAMTLLRVNGYEMPAVEPTYAEAFVPGWNRRGGDTDQCGEYRPVR